MAMCENSAAQKHSLWKGVTLGKPCLRLAVKIENGDSNTKVFIVLEYFDFYINSWTRSKEYMVYIWYHHR